MQPQEGNLSATWSSVVGYPGWILVLTKASLSHLSANAQGREKTTEFMGWDKDWERDPSPDTTTRKTGSN